MSDKFFAFEDALMLAHEQGAIEITEQQYKDALAAKMEGRKAFVKDGELIIYTGKVTTYLKSDCTQQKEFDDKTLVIDDYTLDVPKSRFDEWINNAWVTNLQNQYQAQVQQVNDRRAYLYLDVDRLRAEANSVLEIEGDEAKAEEYRLQANALYLKIRDENPWPVNPETL
ncbi:phage tail protein [Vibrio anguillarum]|uniref:phage tail protein n=1 Tax=Vibrio anguillarum TaxID=55601 RepID=UPI00188CABB9|nr:phage tail protein [Vibrio anguillarum]MBF4256901.1 phage tail protein [Vibrio anguillarum]MBF4278284.1 phage tail protein [Vibrio anguillarum]MBF4298731.1 phage tail protein [Vibrio anguillarum]MBF4362722.1 phage tail protein [Vibrio anguillarum]MBF4396735.1 phage tail protein [Vibrio anguillarum]